MSFPRAAPGLPTDVVSAQTALWQVGNFEDFRPPPLLALSVRRIPAHLKVPELGPTEKIHPCLLTRLTDDEPGNLQESRASRVVSLSRYRHAVLRDLQWLLTTPKPDLQRIIGAEAAKSAGGDDFPNVLEEFPEIATSVLNYGMRSCSGQSLNDDDVLRMERELRETLSAFEPRIDPSSLAVAGQWDRWRSADTELVFEIRGDLFARPTPEELFIKTRLDLETGACTLEENRTL